MTSLRHQAWSRGLLAEVLVSHMIPLRGRNWGAEHELP